MAAYKIEKDLHKTDIQQTADFQNMFLKKLKKLDINNPNNAIKNRVQF